MEITKTRVSIKRTSIQFLIAFLFTGVLLFLILLNFFIFTPFGVSQIIVISIFLALSILFYFLAVFNHYYILGKPGIIYQKFSKRKEFKYDDIVFINKEKSDSSKSIYFVTKFSNVELCIPKDENNLVYSSMLKSCKKLIAEEELARMHPNTKN